MREQLCFILYAASRSVINAYRPGLTRLGLTYPQFATLLLLKDEDGLGVADLAQQLHLDASTISPLLKRMETMGLVRRTRSASDERRVSVSLTDAGRELTGPATQVRHEVGNRLDLTPEEADLLRSLGQRLIDSYDTVDLD